MADIPPTRASLLVRLRDARDEAAWTEFVDLYVPVIYGYARRQGLQDADARDLSQEVLRAVASSIGRLDYDPARGAFRSWLFTVVRRRLANWRRAERNPARGSSVPGTERLEQCLAPPLVEAEWESEWQRRVFDWACDQVRRGVTEATWQAFWLTAVEEQSSAQVAANLGLSTTAVYIARSRVLARLKQLVRSVQEP